MRFLKVLAVLVASALTYNASALSVTVKSKKGGANGYETVTDPTETAPGSNAFIIICENPGTKHCGGTATAPMTVPGTMNPANPIDDVIGSAQTQIAGGSLNGSYTFDGSIAVSFTATDAYNYEIVVSTAE